MEKSQNVGTKNAFTPNYYYRSLNFEVKGLLTYQITKIWKDIPLWKIIVYSWSIINAYSLLSHEWWVPLIKFMVGPTIHVGEESTHLWYYGST